MSVGTAFRKYHGLGNDFVLIDNRTSSDPLLEPAHAVSVCDRRRGVGADGVIFLLPAKESTSDFAMRLYNSDGTEPEMCWNGIRCLARFAADIGINGSTAGKYRVDTLAGPIIPEITAGNKVCVDMGPPILDPKLIPTTLAAQPSAEFTAAGKSWVTTPVSMGNPHSVIFVDDDATFNAMDKTLEKVGPHFECHPSFPAKTNTEFVRVNSETHMDMVVWERGAGRTEACGTGACAVVVAAVLTGRSKRGTDVSVMLPGGELVIRWEEDAKGGNVFMTGPAELVFCGELAAL